MRPDPLGYAVPNWEAKTSASVMAHSEEGSRKTEAPAPASRRVLVYKPCAVCGRAVELSDDTRVQEDPETYECQNCGARFYLDPPTP